MSRREKELQKMKNLIVKCMYYLGNRKVAIFPCRSSSQGVTEFSCAYLGPSAGWDSPAHVHVQ